MHGQDVKTGVEGIARQHLRQSRILQAVKNPQLVRLDENTEAKCLCDRLRAEIEIKIKTSRRE